MNALSGGREAVKDNVEEGEKNDDSDNGDGDEDDESEKKRKREKERESSRFRDIFNIELLVQQANGKVSL